jgi:molybdopterin converting factor subunit 1
MNKVKVLLFATLRQQAGAKSLEIDVPDGTDVHGLKEQLGRDYPALKASMRSVLVSINREYAPEEAVIPVNGEVAFFPPVSGG